MKDLSNSRRKAQRISSCGHKRVSSVVRTPQSQRRARLRRQENLRSHNQRKILGNYCNTLLSRTAFTTRVKTCMGLSIGTKSRYISYVSATLKRSYRSSRCSSQEKKTLGSIVRREAAVALKTEGDDDRYYRE